ncbi:DUF4870 domain-containing protein [Alteribacillus bidgolensis]|uniref:Uncharacterized membrane protein n=1 Tax=Alteribacillus bidgolensis TaxID=930129 RepID=A0A1G8KX79_9BACI|nr:DUF4870 domain-containing protein [Alteribacillus bidgolensis]SDI47989.1 Uncharacterized membrane protein [Alteribacillus bidgolensis]
MDEKEKSVLENAATEEENVDSQEKPAEKRVKTSMGLEENVAGLLCYLLGLITGIVFLVLEKDSRFVRFHALQSIFISGTLVVLNIVLTAIPVLGWLLGLFLSLIGFVLWIVLMVKAYQGKWFKLSIFGDMAEKQLDQMKK